MLHRTYIICLSFDQLNKLKSVITLLLKGCQILHGIVCLNCGPFYET